MITDEGHIIHIDYGFIFSISPAGDMNFEKAAFKLTKEMVEILGGDVRAEAYQLLVHLTVKCFLAVRAHRAEIIEAIYPMFHSGLPCFKPASLKDLENRFVPDYNECQAAHFMR